MVDDGIIISKETLENVLRQLIRSDGMEVTNDYLIKQKVYYIDNTSLVEMLEKKYMEYNYKQLLDTKGQVNISELLDLYTPQFINYDRFYNEMERKYMSNIESTEENKPLKDYTLNKYF